MLIRAEGHPYPLGAVRLAATSAAPTATVVAHLAFTNPVVAHDGGSIDATLTMDVESPIPLSKRKCLVVSPKQAPTLQQLRRMDPVMRWNYEKPPQNFCDRRGLFSLGCRADGCWDHIADCYVPYLPCLDFLFARRIARMNN